MLKGLQGYACHRHKPTAIERAVWSISGQTVAKNNFLESKNSRWIWLWGGFVCWSPDRRRHSLVAVNLIVSRIDTSVCLSGPIHSEDSFTVPCLDTIGHNGLPTILFMSVEMLKIAFASKNSFPLFWRHWAKKKVSRFCTKYRIYLNL